MKNLKNKLSLISFFVGLVLLYFLIRKVGWYEVFVGIKQLRFKMIFVFAFPVTWYAIQSFAWWRILADDGIRVSFMYVFLAKITGEAINTVTPLSFVGGDPYRVYLLQKKVSPTKSMASVVIDRTMYMLAVFLLLLATYLLAWYFLPLPGVWQILFPVITFLFFLSFVVLVFFQRKGLFGLLAGLLHWLGVKRKRMAELSEHIKNLDHHVGRFYSKHKAHFFEIMVLQFAGRFLGVVEIFIIAQFLHLPVSFLQCFFMASLTVLINIAFVFIPGSLGVMEGGYGALFYLMNLNPAFGVTIQLIRRVRAFFWIALGLAAMLVYQPRRVSTQPS